MISNRTEHYDLDFNTLMCVSIFNSIDINFSHKTNNMKTLSLFTLLILISFSSGIAQSKSMEDNFNDYIAEINALNQTKDIKKVVRFLSRDFVYTDTYIGLTGRSRRVEGNFTDYKNSIKGLMSNEDIDLNMKVVKINNIVEDEAFGTISATLSMGLAVNQKDLEKNEFTVTMTAIVDKLGKWKFIQSDVIRTLSERMAGTCVCYFYERNDDFVTELIYPSGFDYVRILNDFKFRTYDDKRVVKSGYKQFEWNKDGSMKELYTEDEEIQLLESAADKKAAALSILSSMYSYECTDIVVR